MTRQPNDLFSTPNIYLGFGMSCLFIMHIKAKAKENERLKEHGSGEKPDTLSPDRSDLSVFFTEDTCY
jgi:hypothetical protein